MTITLREYPLQTNELTLNVAEGPANGPLLLLLHGFSNRWQVFESILPALIPSWRVVTFDLRGHGRSARAPGAYTAGDYYRDLQAVLAHFDADGPLTVIGHSMGGSLALHLAHDYPASVRAVVAGDTSLDVHTHIALMNSRRQTKLFGLRRKLAGRPLEELLRRGLTPKQAEETAQLDPATLDFHAEGRVAEFFRGVANVDFDHIRCPLLLTQANPAKGGLLQDSELPLALQAHPEFEFQRFDSGHDLEIGHGTASPFWQAALHFLQAQR